MDTDQQKLDSKPMPQDIIEKARIIESAIETASRVHAEALKELGEQQQDLLLELCVAEGLDRKEQQIAMLIDRGEYVILKEFKDWEKVAAELMEDVNRQEHSNIVAMCFAFALFTEQGVELPDDARNLLLEMSKELEPNVQERLKAYLYG